MDDTTDTPETNQGQIAFIRPYLSQFRADGVKISTEPVWMERAEELLANLPPDVLGDLVERIKHSHHSEFIDFEVFGAVYGLTPAEVKMVDSVVSGLSVPEHAQAHGISVNTARVHMQRVLEKTGSSRQTDLLRKVFGR